MVRVWRWSKLGVVLLVLCASAALAGPPQAERWVDPGASSGGDGSAAHPFRTLREALAPNARVHLAQGRYRGPFELPPGTRLEGRGQVVLFLDGGGTVLTTKAGAVLRDLSVRGGEVGLASSGGTIRLRKVRFTGQGHAAVVTSAGRLEARDCTFTAVGRLPDDAADRRFPIGLDLKGGTAELRRARFEGPHRRALFIEHGHLVLRKSRIEGAEAGVSLRGGSATLTDDRISRGAGPGIFADGPLHVSRVSISDHGYGLMTGAGATVWADRLTVKRSKRAGLAFVRSSAHLGQVEVDDSGSFGGLQAVGADVEARHLGIHGSGGSGVSQRGGTLRLRSVSISGVGDPTGVEGNGLLVRRGRLKLGRVTVNGVTGVGLWAGAGAHVRFRVLDVHGCDGGLLAERDAQVHGERLTVTESKGPARIILGHARVDIASMTGPKNARAKVALPSGPHLRKGAAHGEERTRRRGDGGDAEPKGAPQRGGP